MISSKDKYSYINKLVCVADSERKKQKLDGSMPETNNGPHQDEETPVRSTAYWLYIFSFLVKNGFETYRNNAELCADYLKSEKARPMKAAFYCRSNPKKDFSNGLIGQAWVIESLLYSYKIINYKELYELAEEVFNQHYWDENTCTWRTLNVDGSYGPLHGTFNQQLWMAAVGSLFDNANIDKKCLSFLSNVLPNIKLYKDGVIYHDSISSAKPKIGTKLYLKYYIDVLRRKKNLKSERLRSVGYHAFNLVALSYIKKMYTSNEIVPENLLLKLASAYKTKSYISEIENKFSYAYNPVGYEYVYFLITNGIDYDKNLLNEQDNTYTFTNYGVKIERHTYDTELTTARLYELCRLLEAQPA